MVFYNYIHEIREDIMTLFRNIIIMITLAALSVFLTKMGYSNYADIANYLEGLMGVITLIQNDLTHIRIRR